jgi:hypothetical protein
VIEVATGDAQEIAYRIDRNIAVPLKAAIAEE